MRGARSAISTSGFVCCPRRFRDLFVDQLRATFAHDELRFPASIVDLADPGPCAARLEEMAEIDWVYSKPPFAGPSKCSAIWPEPLPYRVFDKDQRVTQASIVENKRLSEVLTFVKQLQEQPSRPPKVKTNSERIGYQRTGCKPPGRPGVSSTRPPVVN